MKSTFTVAVIATVASARNLSGSEERTRPDGKLGQDPFFLNFQSEFNKSYVDVEEFNERSQTYHETVEYIEANNKRTEESGNPNGLVLAMNYTGDMTTDELEQMMGLKDVDPNEAAQLYWEEDTLGVVRATTVDHAADGFMGPIKNQGSCGSCVQFAVSSAVEGTLAKQSGRPTEHFSEQHLMDCTYGREGSSMKANLMQRNKDLFGKLYGGQGCSGSWMKNTYRFLEEQGAVDTSRRSYTASESLCEHKDEHIVARGSGYTKVSASINAMKEAVMERPVTVAINASSRAFQLYKSGVITADECSTQQNHAVVIVGFTSDGDDRPEPPTPSTDCTVTDWYHSCRESTERRLQDTNGNNYYWKIQNSWGQNWGDQGFVLFDMQEGAGVCGVNQYVEYVDMQYV